MKLVLNNNMLMKSGYCYLNRKVFKLDKRAEHILSLIEGGKELQIKKELFSDKKMKGNIEYLIKLNFVEEK